MNQLIWHTEQRKINDLIAWEQNPRQMTKRQAEDLQKSLERLNLISIPAIDIDNILVSGHQRCKILQLLGRGNEIIDVRVPNRKLTEEEFTEANLRENKNIGEWDFDILVNFEADFLKDIGWTNEELGNIFQLNLDNKEEEDKEDSEFQNNNFIIQYNIIFNNENEQRIWFDFLKFIKDKYSNDETISERLIKVCTQYMEDHK